MRCGRRRRPPRGEGKLLIRSDQSWTQVHGPIRGPHLRRDRPAAGALCRYCQPVRCLSDTLSRMRSVPEINDAEPVTVRVSEDHEIRIIGVAVPLNPGSAERNKPRRLGTLLIDVGDM
jgi:hypothetical protein